MVGKAQRVGFEDFVKTYRPRTYAPAWIKTIPEYPLIVDLYDKGRGTYVDMDGSTQPITPTTLHRWLLARGYSTDVCKVNKVKHWCDEQRAEAG